MERSQALLDATAQVLDLELELVSTAISMVASGAAPRVRLAGLRFGEQLLGEARLLARSAGVQVTPLWPGADDDGVSLSVERPLDVGP
jgi:hypothetical protein